MVVATVSGDSPYPSSRSALRGTEIPPAISWTRRSMVSRSTRSSAGCSAKKSWSVRPRENATPALVVATAGKPAASRIRALPTSHALGSRKQPSRCRSAKRCALARLSVSTRSFPARRPSTGSRRTYARGRREADSFSTAT